MVLRLSSVPTYYDADLPSPDGNPLVYTRAYDVLLVSNRDLHTEHLIDTLDSLSAGNCNIDHQTALDDALILIKHASYDVVLLDTAAFNAPSLTLVDEIKSTNTAAALVLMLSPTEQASIEQLVRAGASDCIEKPCEDSQLVLKTLEYAIEKRATRQHLDFVTQHDPLTGLANRELFNRLFSQALERASTNRTQVALLFLDLDRFKSINETLGHEAGDELLVTIACRLQRCVRESDEIFRLGGDEFLIVLEDIWRKSDAELVCQEIIKSFEQPVTILEQELYVTTSVGLAYCPDDGNDITSLLCNAEAAMYRAKETGRNKYQSYTPAQRLPAMSRLSIETELRRAIEREQFQVMYQPKIELSSGSVIGAEALIRWLHPDRGQIPPNDFIPVAEDTGLIVPIGQWVLEESCRAVIRWMENSTATVDRPLKVAVNLSPRQFRQGDIVSTVSQAISTCGISSDLLELEITENLLMEDTDSSQKLLRDLKELGISLFLDDFGTGYSSLGYLKKFPLDGLKIDRSFIRDIPQDIDDVEITRAIIALSRALKLKVVAEGVETQRQLDFLTAENCDEVQGFFYAKPLPYDEFVNWIYATNANGKRRYAE